MGLRVKPEDDEKVKPEDYGGAQNKIDCRASLAKTKIRHSVLDTESSSLSF